MKGKGKPLWLRAILTVARLLASVDATATGGERDTLRRTVDRLRTENELLRARLKRVPAAKRARYRAWERLRILWHRARYRLSLRDVARMFVVTVGTVERWLQDVERQVQKLVTGRAPMNKLPDLVRELAHLLRWEQVRWGTRRIADVLARLGLTVSRSSVQRILRTTKPGRPASARSRIFRGRQKGLRAKRANQIWLIDLTKVKVLFGLIDMRIGAVLDAFTRKIRAIRVHVGEPNAAWACGLVCDAIRQAGAKPKHLVSDQGSQFTALRFVRFLRRRGIAHRYGAIGSSQSLTYLERAWRSLKEECLGGALLWITRRELERRVRTWVEWHAAHRPHQGLRGRTPNEVLNKRAPVRRLRVRDGEQWEVMRRDLDGEASCPVYRLRRVA